MSQTASCFSPACANLGRKKTISDPNQSAMPGIFRKAFSPHWLGPEKGTGHISGEWNKYQQENMETEGYAFGCSQPVFFP